MLKNPVLVEGPPVAFLGFAGAARQTWGRHFAAFGLTDLPLFAVFALTYDAYAPRVKTAAAFPSTPLRADWTDPSEKIGFFEHSLPLCGQLLIWTLCVSRSELFNGPSYERVLST